VQLSGRGTCAVEQQSSNTMTAARWRCVWSERWRGVAWAASGLRRHACRPDARSSASLKRSDAGRPAKSRRRRDDVPSDRRCRCYPGHDNIPMATRRAPNTKQSIVNVGDAAGSVRRAGDDQLPPLLPTQRPFRLCASLSLSASLARVSSKTQDRASQTSAQPRDACTTTIVQSPKCR